MRVSSMPAWLPADPNKRRAVAAALLLLSIMVIAAAVCVPAVLLHRHYDENIARLVRQVGTQTAFNALRPRLAEKLDSLKSRDVKKLFLKGTSSALALAELQEAVRTAIEANGGRVVSSVQGNAPKEEGAYRQVAATFNMNTNNANLRRVLYTLESREPYLFIDSVVIQPQGYRPAPGAPEPDMFVQLDVRAFALRTASEMAPPSPPQTAPGSSPTSKDKAAAT